MKYFRKLYKKLMSKKNSSKTTRDSEDKRLDLAMTRIRALQEKKKKTANAE